jgi:hypothetical protein
MKQATIIPLKLDYGDESSIHWIKPSQLREIGGVNEKTPIEVPRLSEDSRTYELLNFIREFSRAYSIMSWMTGLRLSEKFKMHASKDSITRCRVRKPRAKI